MLITCCHIKHNIQVWRLGHGASMGRGILYSACAQLLGHVWLFVIPRTIAHQPPLSMEFSRQEYWNGLPVLYPGDLPNPGIKPRSLALQADSLPSEPQAKPIILPIIPYCSSGNNLDWQNISNLTLPLPPWSVTTPPSAVLYTWKWK